MARLKALFAALLILFAANTAGLDPAAGQSIRNAGIHRNVVIPQMPEWSAALSAYQAGTANARAMFIGDSETAGFDNSNGGLDNNNKARSTPTYFAGYFQHGGLLSFTGNQNATSSRNYDFRITFATGWSFSPSDVMGGFALLAPTNTNFLNFDPQGATWDTAEIYSLGVPTGGAFNVDINQTTVLGSVATNVASTFNKTTYTKTLGADTLNFSRTSGTNNYIQGYILYNSAVKEVTVLNVGWSGATSGDLNQSASPWKTLPAIALYRPDLVVINIGVNDWKLASPIDQPTYKANVQAVIDAARAAGASVQLIVPFPSGDANSIANMPAFQTSLYELATLNNLPPPIDLIQHFVSFAQANADGYTANNGSLLHPNAAGYAEIARFENLSIGLH